MSIFLDLPKIKSSPNLKYHLYRQKTLEQAPNGVASDEEMEETELDVNELKNDELLDKEEKQIEALHTIKCHVIAPGVVVEGTLAIANSFLYFTADDESLAVQRVDPTVSAYCKLPVINYLLWILPTGILCLTVFNVGSFMIFTPTVALDC